MSIEARLAELQKARTEEGDRLEAQRRKQEGERKQRYSNGRLEAQKQQAILLEELRELGIVKMLEELKFNPEKFQELYEDKFAFREWKVEILYPGMLETGEADPTLVFQLNKFGKYPLSPRDLTGKPIARVFVSYDVDRQLEIKGKEITFRGVIPVAEQERNEILETSIAKALDQPEPIIRQDRFH